LQGVDPDIAAGIADLLDANRKMTVALSIVYRQPLKRSRRLQV
jgi:hypothetical protein